MGLSVGLFLLGLVLSTSFALWKQREIGVEAELQFQRRIERVTLGIEQRFDKVVYGLNGVKALFAARENIKRAEFLASMASHDMAHEFPGVRGFGFLQRVKQAEVAAFVANTQADGMPQFAIKQLYDTRPDDLYVAKFIEPAASNAGVLGFDTGSDTAPREALLHAIDTGEATLTSALRLLQDEGKTPGVLMFVPVYANGSRHLTVQERRNAIIGLVYAPIVINELLNKLAAVEIDRADFDLFDGIPGSPGATLMFDADKHSAHQTDVNAAPLNRRFSITKPITLPGRDFTIRVNSTSKSDAQYDQATPWLIFFASTLFSGLLALLVRQQSLGRRRAEQLALGMTADLAQMAQVVQHTFNAVSIADRHGKISWVNPGFERITGYSAADAVGKTHAEILGSGKAEPLVLQQLADAAVSGRHCRVEILNRAKDGREFWVDTEIQPQFDASGQVTGFMEISSDITANKLNEARSQAQKELMQSILDNIPIGLSAFDNALNLIAKNHEFQTALDLPDTLFEGPITTFESIIRFNANRGEYGQGDHALMVESIIERARHPAVHQLERVRPNGVVLEVLGAPLPGGGFVTTYANISARKRAEAVEKSLTEQLRLDEARSHDFSLSASDWFWETDAQHRFCFFSNSFEQMYGQPQNHLLGKSRQEILELDQLNPAEIVKAHLSELHAHLPFKNFEYQIRQTDGHVIWVSVAGVPHLDVDGKFAGYRGTGTLISERKANEETLRQAVLFAQAATLAKSQFLANMSHEIRTPMNGVLGMLELLKAANLNDRQHDYAQKAEGAARSLMGILNDILDFSKVEAGKLELDPEPFCMSDVARDVQTILAGNLKEKKVDLVFDLDPTLPRLMLGDAGRLRQVLINLGGNAIKFTALGEVRIRTRVRRLESTKVVLAFEVIDSGIGLSPEQQLRVFAGFSQAEASTSRRFGGTGLGLAISQRLVALMGGALKVTSRLGEGSTFYFDLHFPLCEQQNNASTEPTPSALTDKTPASEPQLVGLRVLLVEDNPINQMVARELLGQHGALVQLAENGQLAIEALLATPAGFDVVLMDLQMPVMDGFQATRHIRQQLNLTELPIIAMTANVMASDREDSLAAGMNDHIGKPFHVKELVARLLRYAAP